MSWKFPHLTEISPTGDRDFGQVNPFSRLSEIIFSYEEGAKKYNVSFYRL